MHKKAISVLTSLFLALVPFSSANVYAESGESVVNVFTLNHDYNGDTVVSVLSIDGENVSLGGLEAVLQYDTSKYSINTMESTNPNVLLNEVQSTGEIIMSMAVSDNLSEPSELVTIEFECSGIPVDSDFTFEITDAYRFADNYDSESVEYSINETWSGLDEIPDITTSTTTQPATTTTPVTTTISETTLTETTSSEMTSTTVSTIDITTTTTTHIENAVSNNFVISVKKNETENKVELSFAVRGNVGFWTAEGSININATGLGVPELLTAIPDALTSYNVEDNSLYFTIVSSSGGNITEEQTIFTYVFPIEESECSISCTGKISDICDQNYNDVNYTLAEENEITPSPNTTTTTTASETTTTTTTTAEVTTTEPTTTDTNATTALITTTDGSTTTTETEITVSFYELSNWAENDYYKKTGVEPYRSEYTENSNGTLTITLYDEQGNVLDIYTVHPKTGIGFNSDGDNVDLPQTGNNSALPLLIVIWSLLMVLIGAYIISTSGVLHRKHGHENG